MLGDREFLIEQVDWASVGPVLRAIRFDVFVTEQGVPEALEWDGMDPLCVHVLARNRQGAPIGTGRLLPDCHIGRMAVLKECRRSGVGSAMLAKLVELARHRGDREVCLNAQSYVVEFYRRAGFQVTSDEFIEAGIPHRQMTLRIGAA